MKDAVLKRFAAALPPAIKSVLRGSTVDLLIKDSLLCLSIQVNATDLEEARRMFGLIEKTLEQLCHIAKLTTQASRLVLQFPAGEPIDVDLDAAFEMQNALDEAEIDLAGGVGNLTAIAERTDALLQMIPEMSAIIDLDGTILATNAPSVFPVEQNIVERVPPERRAMARERFATVKASGKAFYREDESLQLNSCTASPHQIEITPCGQDLMVLCQRKGVAKMPIREVQDR